MPVEDVPTEDRPMLAYATPEIQSVVGDLLLMPMRAWRRYTAWGLLAAFIGGIVWWPMALMALVFVLVACVMTLVTMTRYAAHNFGTAYAVRHLLLAIVLSPILLLGVFLVSRLVQADIERWHLNADRPPT